jgi:hypothetical protein
VAAATIYTWVTPERNRGDREDWFGIHPPATGGAGTDTRAFAEGLALARAPGATAHVCARR